MIANLLGMQWDVAATSEVHQLLTALCVFSTHWHTSGGYQKLHRFDYVIVIHFFRLFLSFLCTTFNGMACGM